MRYTDTVTLPGGLTLDSAESVEELLRGYGSIEKRGRVLTFTIEADDLWALHEMVGEIQTELNSRCIDFEPDRAKVSGVGPLDALRRSLEGLRDHGFQPMYNGRPSCPFCSNFVDEEETHSPGCILVRSLA